MRGADRQPPGETKMISTKLIGNDHNDVHGRSLKRGVASMARMDIVPEGSRGAAYE
jgi:hypothetical protein